MKYKTLGHSGLKVSEVCLGTMTWGEQNTQSEAFAQINYAISRGINFIDTAEMYSIPPKPETYGSTESILGQWIAQNKTKRNELVIASKAAGPGIDWIRKGSLLTKNSLIQALDASLKRLQTDYIDLYQIHWPNRNSPHFGRHWPNALAHTKVDSEQQTEMMLNILEGLGEAIKSGKINHCGLSDETPWGISEYIRLSNQYSLPRMTSIQNEFSLLHLKDSPYLIESCVMNDIAYLPWSPLGGGVLSGKYRNGKRPKNTRWAMSQRNGLFRDTEQTREAVEVLHKVSVKHNISLAQMSLSYINQIDGVTASIIGATNLEQLKENINAYSIRLTDEIMDEISLVIKHYPMPF